MLQTGLTIVSITVVGTPAAATSVFERTNPVATMTIIAIILSALIAICHAFYFLL